MRSTTLRDVQSKNLSCCNEVIAQQSQFHSLRVSVFESSWNEGSFPQEFKIVCGIWNKAYAIYRHLIKITVKSIGKQWQERTTKKSIGWDNYIYCLQYILFHLQDLKMKPRIRDTFCQLCSPHCQEKAPNLYWKWNIDFPSRLEKLPWWAVTKWIFYHILYRA